MCDIVTWDSSHFTFTACNKNTEWFELAIKPKNSIAIVNNNKVGISGFCAKIYLNSFYDENTLMDEIFKIIRLQIPGFVHLNINNYDLRITQKARDYML